MVPGGIKYVVYCLVCRLLCEELLFGHVGKMNMDGMDGWEGNEDEREGRLESELYSQLITGELMPRLCRRRPRNRLMSLSLLADMKHSKRVKRSGGSRFPYRRLRYVSPERNKQIVQSSRPTFGPGVKVLTIFLEDSHSGILISLLQYCMSCTR